MAASVSAVARPPSSGSPGLRNSRRRFRLEPPESSASRLDAGQERSTICASSSRRRPAPAELDAGQELVHDMRQLKPPKVTAHSTLIPATECLKVIDTFRLARGASPGIGRISKSRAPEGRQEVGWGLTIGASCRPSGAGRFGSLSTRGLRPGLNAFAPSGLDLLPSAGQG